MARYVTVGAAQFGPVQRRETRCEVVDRLLALLEQGRTRGCDLVVFTEVALTPFSPHWHMEDQEEIEAYFERHMPGPNTRPRGSNSWVVGVAKAGIEEGVEQIGQSCIIAPSGEVVAMCSTLGDELVTARCDLDQTTRYKRTTFNFGAHRRTEHYRMIVERAGAELPP